MVMAAHGGRDGRSADKLPRMDWYPADYHADRNTRVMSLEEHGAYRLLLDFEWMDGPLPTDHGELAALLGVTLAKFKRVWRRVGQCFVEEDGHLINPRLERERARAMKARGVSRRKGRAGAEGKWGPTESQKRGRENRAKRMRAARAKGTHTRAEWEAMRDAYGACLRCGATDKEIVRDHIVPIYQGGSDAITNIQPLCRSCNASKGPEDEDLRIGHPATLPAWLGQASARHQAGDECLPASGPSPSSVNRQPSSPPTPPPGGRDGLARSGLESRWPLAASELRGGFGVGTTGLLDECLGKLPESLSDDDAARWLHDQRGIITTGLLAAARLAQAAERVGPVYAKHPCRTEGCDGEADFRGGSCLGCLTDERGGS